MNGRSFELEAVPRPGERLRAAATIGVFDGVHRGHRALFDHVRREAEARNVASVVLTFDPYPIEVFAPNSRRHRIASRAVGARLIEDAGIDHVWFLPFSKEMAAWEPIQFLRHLQTALDLTSLWVGPDFRFGKDRAGDFDFLAREGERDGFEVRRIEPLVADGRQVSSTWIRELLREGRLDRAQELLGHPFEVDGPVIHGQGLGARELVATANLKLAREQLLPRRGIYAGWAIDPAGEWTATPLPAVASVGVRPTLGPDGDDWVEVHLLDWDGDIYGRRLAFEFIHWIRPEKAFPSLEALRSAIDEDLALARSLLRERDGTSPLHQGR
ncbi:MAG: riboflavin biosynthesis protein RibF [Candidatus Eisenbacteria bacterium]